MAGLNRVDLNLLPLLAALLEHRNVTRAAQEVGLTQPAMSNALRRLRRTLDDELLVRVGRETVLTARAEALVAPVATILRTVTGQVLTPPEFDPATSARTFHLAGGSASVLTVLPALSATIARCAPDVRVFVEPQGEMDLTSSTATADVALIPEVASTVLPRERLYDEDWVLVADGTNERLATGLSTEALARLPHVVFQWGDEALAAHRALAAQVPDLVVQVVVPEFLMIPPIVRGTPMVALLQRRLATVLAESHGLRIHESPVPLPTLHIDMVWHPRNVGDPGSVWLRRRLVEAVA